MGMPLFTRVRSWYQKAAAFSPRDPTEGSSAAPTKRVPQRSEDCLSDWALPKSPLDPRRRPQSEFRSA